MFVTDRQTGQFGLVVGMGVQRSATDDDAVVQHDRKMIDFAFQQFARPMDEDAFLLHRLDQRDQCRDVVRLGFADVFQRLASDDSADAVVGE